MTTTATGADGSGSTEDACIEVPSESCIVRCSMYVEPMGRNVIFYFYPGDYQSGNQTDFKAINVTETSNVSDGAQENKSEQSDTDKLDESSRETMKSEENNSSAMTPGKWILVLTVSMTLSGLILMAAGTGIFLFLQKHGELWKGDEDDE